jgi:hypothetical protein
VGDGSGVVPLRRGGLGSRPAGRSRAKEERAVGSGGVSEQRERVQRVQGVREGDVVSSRARERECRQRRWSGSRWRTFPPPRCVRDVVSVASLESSTGSGLGWSESGGVELERGGRSAAAQV